MLNQVLGDAYTFVVKTEAKTVRIEKNKHTIKVSLHHKLIALEKDRVLENCIVGYKGRKYIESILLARQTYLKQEATPAIDAIKLSHNRGFVMKDTDKNPKFERIFSMSRIAFNDTFDEGFFSFNFEGSDGHGEIIFVRKHEKHWFFEYRFKDGCSKKDSLAKEPKTYYSLKDALDTPNKVEILNLNGRNLNTFPKKIFQLTHLKKLYLKDNQLGLLPKEIVSLNSLKELDLEDNNISLLPKEISKLKSLKGVNFRWKQARVSSK